MPEGDTIFRAARTLNLALAGKTVTRFTSAYPALTRVDDDTPIAGRMVARVDARGKHLLMHFGEGVRRTAEGTPGGPAPPLILRTHMRMNGSWHIYAKRRGPLHPARLPHSRGPQSPAPFGRDLGEPWQLPRWQARIIIETDDFVAVGFNVPIAEFLDEAQAARQSDLRSIGPDLLGETFDEDEA